MTDTIDITKLHRREYEVFTSIARVWPEWQRCQHGKRCVTVWAHWSNDAPFKVTDGEINESQYFTRDVHIDGSHVHGKPSLWPDGSHYKYCTCEKCGRVETFEYGQHSQCPKCKSIDTLTTKQLAYGDETTCITDGCDYNSYYSIGD